MQSVVCGQDVSLPDMNDAEQVFNYVAAHLLKQNKRSVCDNHQLGNICMYRGKDDMSCAAGCLIPDDDYNQDDEGCGVRTIEFFNKFSNHVKSLLRKLQVIHDSYDPCGWPKMLNDLAKQNNFKMEIV